MSKMKYERFINELKDMAEKGVEENVDKMNNREKAMLPVIAIYYQEKLTKMTFWLVIATWALAVATILAVWLKP